MNSWERPKDSIFSKKVGLNCRGKLLNMTTPKLMGILNLTPDSFHDGGQLKSDKAILNQAETMLSEGADILDLGGYSSRPGAKEVPLSEEINRVVPAIDLLHKAFPEVPLSVDTFRGKVAQLAIDSGAAIINDISAGTLDDEMIPTVVRNNVPYVLMHMQGQPATMQKSPEYQNVTRDVILFLSKKVNDLRLAGVKDLIIDPGFGFGKTLKHNYQLMADLEQFQAFNLPIMVGVSRKSMINQVLGTSPANALNGTTVLHTMALLNGASILRVHDIKAAKETLKIVQHYQNT
jgi:dihydropteroate synthase